MWVGTFWERIRSSVLLCVGSIGYYNEVDHLQGSPTVIALGHSEHCIIGDSISSLPTRPENQKKEIYIHYYACILNLWVENTAL